MIPRVERRQFHTDPHGIFTKEKFRALDAAGKLGNHFQSWPNWVSLIHEGDGEWITIRNLVPNSPLMVLESGPGLWKWKADLNDLLRRGAKSSDLYFQEIPAPDNRRVINFEVRRSPEYLWMLWATGQQPLRTDLEQNGHIASGLAALEILRFYLDHEDFEQLDAIWDRWPNAIVEATRWSQRVGVDHKHLILWEARQY
jgi:hypothetical protein